MCFKCLTKNNNFLSLKKVGGCYNIEKINIVLNKELFYMIYIWVEPKKYTLLKLKKKKKANKGGCCSNLLCLNDDE